MTPILALLAAIACHKPEPEPEPHVPDLPTGGCGLTSYDWLPTETMGEVLAWEPVESASFPAATFNALLEQVGLEGVGPVPYGTRVFRVRYRTQDKGAEVEATGLLAFPDTTEAIEVPSLGWMHPTVGFSDACAPSGGAVEDLLGATVFAAFGFAIAAPDYLGMAGWGEPSGELHPYAVPEPTAVASLDALRALHDFQDRRLDPSIAARATEQTLLWGASEGGFAALWADRYAPEYAPELDVIGVIASVPPTDFVGIAREGVSAPIDATVGLAGVLTASWDWYEGVGVAPLSAVMQDAPPRSLASNIAASMLSDCGGGDVLDGVSTVEDIFLPSFVEAVQAGDLGSIEPFGCYLETATLSQSAIPRASGAPVFFQVSEHDSLVVGHVERADAPVLCAAGYELEYLECAGASHVSGAVDSLPLQLRWAQARVAGESLGPTCEIGPPVDCAALASE